MKKYYSWVIILILLFTLWNCDESKKQPLKSTITTTIQEKIANLKDSNNKEIIVVAHRGDWRNAPENSLQAIKNCIDMGVDMVEIDVRETKDGQLVLMHDDTINRTTTGKGFVNEWSLDSLNTIRLIDGLGVPTQHRIPTLKDALMLSKDKILINLDKSYKIFDKCYEIIKETGTENQVVIKGVKRKSEVEQEFSDYLNKILFMPIVRLEKQGARAIIDEYMEDNPPIAIEFIVGVSDTLKIINEFDEMREMGTSIWVNSLWPPHNGGHDDEKAALNTKVYDWYISNNIDIIQTDRPQLLLDYLRSKGLHD